MLSVGLDYKLLFATNTTWLPTLYALCVAVRISVFTHACATLRTIDVHTAGGGKVGTYICAKECMDCCDNFAARCSMQCCI